MSFSEDRNTTAIFLDVINIHLVRLIPTGIFSFNDVFISKRIGIWSIIITLPENYFKED